MVRLELFIRTCVRPPMPSVTLLIWASVSYNAL